MAQDRIGFIGAGQMARALGQGWIASGLTTADRIAAYDISAGGLAEFARRIPGCRAERSNEGLAASCPILVLAVKPASVPEALSQIQDAVDHSPLVISIAAGISLETLETALPSARVARVMPNTPCLVGQGASAFCLGKHATPADGALVKSMFEAVGFCMEAPEAWLDAVTGLSGSGPGFLLLVLEALIDGGVRMGLPRDQALQLAAHTMVGTGQWVLQEQTHPAILRDRVSSPGGTTLAGLFALESRGVRGAFMEAVEAATRKSRGD